MTDEERARRWLETVRPATAEETPAESLAFEFRAVREECRRETGDALRPIRRSLMTAAADMERLYRTPMTMCAECDHVKNKHLTFDGNTAIIIPCAVEGCRCAGYRDVEPRALSGPGEKVPVDKESASPSPQIRGGSTGTDPLSHEPLPEAVALRLQQEFPDLCLLLKDGFIWILDVPDEALAATEDRVTGKMLDLFGFGSGPMVSAVGPVNTACCFAKEHAAYRAARAAKGGSGA